MKKIAVLLTCYNRRKETINCLRKLYLNDLPFNYTLDVFLVDDSSTDDTKEKVKQEFPNVILIDGTGELFWNRGMFMSWKTASKIYDFDYYFWLNDDVELFKNSICDMISVAKVKGNSIICGTMKSKNDNIITYGGLNNKGIIIIPNNSVQECFLFNGNFVLIPKNVFHEVGNLDYLFPHAIGDFDYALRAKKKGINSYICPEYIGLCEKHNRPPVWCRPEIGIFVRIKNLYSPLGNAHPYYFFLYERRHFGLYRAVKHFLSIHLRLLFPYLWKNN